VRNKPNHEPTWDDVGAIASAIVALTRGADLPHDDIVELALPLIRRLAAMGESLLLDPHGDGYDDGLSPKTWRMYTPEETAAALSNLDGTQMQAALLDALGCHKESEASTAALASIVGEADIEKAWYALRSLDYLDYTTPDGCVGAMSVEQLGATVWAKPEGYPEDNTDEEWATLRINEANRLGLSDLAEYWAEWLRNQGPEL
jgi:hypothetical protein